jgi:hypothetical protein
MENVTIWKRNAAYWGKSINTSQGEFSVDKDGHVEVPEDLANELVDNRNYFSQKPDMKAVRSEVTGKVEAVAAENIVLAKGPNNDILLDTIAVIPDGDLEFVAESLGLQIPGALKGNPKSYRAMVAQKMPAEGYQMLLRHSLRLLNAMSPAELGDLKEAFAPKKELAPLSPETPESPKKEEVKSKSSKDEKMPKKEAPKSKEGEEK